MLYLIITAIFCLYLLGGLFTAGAIRDSREYPTDSQFWTFVFWPLVLFFVIVIGCCFRIWPFLSIICKFFFCRIVAEFILFIYHLGDCFGQYWLQEWRASNDGPRTEA